MNLTPSVHEVAQCSFQPQLPVIPRFGAPKTPHHADVLMRGGGGGGAGGLGDARQQQHDSKFFFLDAHGKYKADFKCDHHSMMISLLPQRGGKPRR